MLVHILVENLMAGVTGGHQIVIEDSSQVLREGLELDLLLLVLSADEFALGEDSLELEFKGLPLQADCRYASGQFLGDEPVAGAAVPEHFLEQEGDRPQVAVDYLAGSLLQGLPLLGKLGAEQLHIFE